VPPSRALGHIGEELADRRGELPEETNLVIKVGEV
jgi:hypothetical protein